ncbi:hypothetical protein NL676_031202 [Syzygium grande]|nr:hypothetical protein NL676_031202 [Syzygium grande]
MGEKLTANRAAGNTIHFTLSGATSRASELKAIATRVLVVLAPHSPVPKLLQKGAVVVVVVVEGSNRTALAGEPTSWAVMDGVISWAAEAMLAVVGSSDKPGRMARSSWYKFEDIRRDNYSSRWQCNPDIYCPCTSLAWLG